MFKIDQIHEYFIFFYDLNKNMILVNKSFQWFLQFSQEILH